MLETILAIIGSLGGITGVVSLLYVKQERKSKELDNQTKDLDNEAKQSEEWKKLYDEERACLQKARQDYDSTIKEKDTKIDELFDEISNQRNQKVELHNQIASMTVELTKLKMLKCEVANCPNRKPPTGY
jgi:uncharacterized protein (DUF3084 family)